MITILVSGASGIVGQGILKSLRKNKEHLWLIGTSIYEDSAAEGFCDVFEKAVPTNDPKYIDWLCSIISRHDVDMIIPGIDADMYKWSECLSEIKNSNVAYALLNKPELISLCKNKYWFYNKLRSFSTPYAIASTVDGDFIDLSKKLGLPFLLKPVNGFGSKGIVRIDTIEKYFEYKDRIRYTDLMAQQIVGTDDEEYTTSAFCDGKGGYFASMTLKRKLSKDGYTDRAEVVTMDAKMNEAVHVLCEIFKPLGCTNFQFRRHEGVLKLLEINPRISSSTSIRTAFGYNESAMAVDYFLNGIEPKQPVIREGRAVRYTEDMIFYK
jgi:carbamoyl-phosphate synthase large subunit